MIGLRIIGSEIIGSNAEGWREGLEVKAASHSLVFEPVSPIIYILSIC